jgi:hypothetical protein
MAEVTNVIEGDPSTVCAECTTPEKCMATHACIIEVIAELNSQDPDG